MTVPWSEQSWTTTVRSIDSLLGRLRTLVGTAVVGRADNTLTSSLPDLCPFVAPAAMGRGRLFTASAVAARGPASLSAGAALAGTAAAARIAPRNFPGLPIDCCYLCPERPLMPVLLATPA